MLRSGWRLSDLDVLELDTRVAGLMCRAIYNVPDDLPDTRVVQTLIEQKFTRADIDKHWPTVRKFRDLLVDERNGKRIG